MHRTTGTPSRAAVPGTPSRVVATTPKHSSTSLNVKGSTPVTKKKSSASSLSKAPAPPAPLSTAHVSVATPPASGRTTRKLSKPSSATATAYNTEGPKLRHAATLGFSSTTRLHRPVLSSDKAPASHEIRGNARVVASQCVTPVRPALAAHSVVPMPAGSQTNNTSLSGTAIASGEKLEPNRYRVSYVFQGTYACVEPVSVTASLWAANSETGFLDVYNAVTGQLATSLPSPGYRIGASAATEEDLARSHTHQRALGLTPRGGASVTSASASMINPSTFQSAYGATSISASNAIGSAPVVARPIAMKSTATHMWVGFDNGAVRVYDVLVLRFVTEGKLHDAPVVDFAMLKDGTVVSASSDGGLIQWDAEEKKFEAIRHLFVSDAVATRRTHLLPGTKRVSASPITCITASRRVPTIVYVGFVSGIVAVFDVADSGTTYEILKAHTQRVNDIAVVPGDLVFTASQDCTVKIWSFAAAVASSTAAPPVSTSSAQPAAATGAALVNGTTHRLVKKLSVEPGVRSFVTDELTHSIWSAYSDGLLERWSANPDDDFGVEEVIRDGMKIAASAYAPECSASLTPFNLRANVVCEAGTSQAAILPHDLARLHALSAVETLQVLALSSNGVNRVWYGHRNTTEENLTRAIATLNAVIHKDTEDTAVWVERLNVLRQKELERKGKYVIILEQLVEQRVLRSYFEAWRRVLVSRAGARGTAYAAQNLEERSSFALRRRFFTKWAKFYDAQQRHFRRHLLAKTLADATRRSAAVTVFHRWQAGVVRRRLKHGLTTSVTVMARMSAVMLIARYWSTWMRFKRHVQAGKKGGGRLSNDGAGAHVGKVSRAGTAVSSEQLELIANKVQRQVLHRALRTWMDAHAQSFPQSPTSAAAAIVLREAAAASLGNNSVSFKSTLACSPLWKFAEVFARHQQLRAMRHWMHMWKMSVRRKAKMTHLMCLAQLRAECVMQEMLQSFYLRWTLLAQSRQLDRHAREIATVEAQLHAAEAEHGDIFEKLQLQKRIDQLIQQQEGEEWALAQEKERLTQLTQNRDTLLSKSTDQKEVLGQEGTLRTQAGVVPSGVASRHAPMSSNKEWYCSVIDQQRLYPAVLTQMPLPEAVRHVMAQLKGNVVNTYTDMALFRHVKDRTRGAGGVTAIFLESFNEVKRLIVVATVKGRVKAGGMASRWPLTMEALDSIPPHNCAKVLSAIKMMVVSFDLLSPEDAVSVVSTCEEVVANADWVYLIARACYMRRKPVLPVNNRQQAR